ncbi:hypothetical protein ACFLRX_04825 [Acidobacteriota bacterium]
MVAEELIPWWVKQIVIPFVLGLLLLFISLMVTGKIKIRAWTDYKEKRNRRKSREKKEKNRERERMVNLCNQRWRHDIDTLRDLYNRFAILEKMDTLGLLAFGINKGEEIYFILSEVSFIEDKAKSISRPEYKEIKEKILRYTAKKNKVGKNTSLEEVQSIFRREVESKKNEPWILSIEIGDIVKNTTEPPFSIGDFD